MVLVKRGGGEESKVYIMGDSMFSRMKKSKLVKAFATRDVKLEATLTDSEGSPLSGKTINFYYRLHGETTWSNAGSGTTDTNGKASVTVSLSVPNSYDFRAEFPGDADYEASSDEKDNVKIKAKTTVTLTVTPL